MTALAPIEAAITTAILRVLTSRAAVLRQRASSLITTTTDGAGRRVRITTPEAVTMLGTADLFDECAADLKEIQ